MCGFVAVVRGDASPPSEEQLGKLVATIKHRGPDAQSTWTSRGVGLAHARLSILDLSPSGAQPMHSPGNGWSLAFNGEIYNHKKLRSQLNETWRGHSDTETLLSAIECWGVEQTLPELSGMFAFTAWDHRNGCLWLARDRMGEKPLYYGLVDGEFRAASELKALIGDSTRPEVDTDSLALLFRHNYIPAPHTIWKGIRKLPPGHVLRVSMQDVKAGRIPEPTRWFDLTSATQVAPYAGSFVDAVDELERLLLHSVGEQMISDVPLGAFLSGGIDSSLVVAMMQAQSTERIRTFTIGFEEANFNESIHAESIAKHLGTNHTCMHVSAQDALNLVPEISSIWDEPFADSSQIPTYLLSRLTRQHVTVSLSGDGGDELFAGYGRYALFKKLERILAYVPPRLGRAASTALRLLPSAAYQAALAPLRAIRPSMPLTGDRVLKAASLLGASHLDEIYRSLVSHCPQPEQYVLAANEPATILNASDKTGPRDYPRRLQYLDQLSYLPDDILVKVDRAAMANSLETRVPLLNKDVVQFAWSLPNEFTFHDNTQKRVLQEVLARYVPKEMFQRPKMGFGIPLKDWLRGPLREWSGDLLAESRLRRDGFLDPERINQLWTEHQSGQRNWQALLWSALMFQSWLERWR